jgi:hypothetical protein
MTRTGMFFCPSPAVLRKEGDPICKEPGISHTMCPTPTQTQIFEWQELFFMTFCSLMRFPLEKGRKTKNKER